MIAPTGALGPAWGWFFTRHAFINRVAPYYGWVLVTPCWCNPCPASSRGGR